MPEEETPWVIKGVSERTKRRVKAYAAEQGLTMAEAIERIVERGLWAIRQGLNDPDKMVGDLSDIVRPIIDERFRELERQRNQKKDEGE